MYAGKAEWLLLFLTQHTRKSIGSKEAVFHGVHFRPCLLCLCVSITSLTSVAALCLSLMLPPTSAGSSHLIRYLFFFKPDFSCSFTFIFPLLLQIIPFFFFFASPIPNHANSCTCFCNISKFTDQFFFLWSLLCFSTIFVDFFFVFDFHFKI